MAVDAIISARVHAEVARWKEIHDAELARRKRWTIGASLLGFVMSAGIGGAVYSFATDSVTKQLNAAKDAAIEAERAADKAKQDAEQAVVAAVADVTARAQYQFNRLWRELQGDLESSGESISGLIDTAIASDPMIVRYSKPIQLQFRNGESWDDGFLAGNHAGNVEIHGRNQMTVWQMVPSDH